MSEKKVPQLRFPEFTDDWEQRKLGELVKIGDIDHRMPPSVDEGIPYLMTGDFCGVNELNFTDVKCVSEEDYNQLSKKIKPEKGDILFARYASVGAVRYVNFDRKFLISYSCAIIKKSDKVDTKYLYQYLTTESAQKQIAMETVTGSQPNIGMDSMKKNISIPVTNEAEQLKIGEYFFNLDNLITLHQRKVDLLRKLKKGMLQKMFPRDGADTPEIRFPGFTAPWEQRKFSEVVQVRRGLTYKPSDVQETGVRVLRSSNINEDTFVYGDDDVFVNPEAVNIEAVKQNDILITSANGSSRLVGKHALIKEIPDDSAVHGGFMLLGRTKNYEFINASMSSSWYTKFINIYVAGGNGAIGNLSKSDLDEQIILVPSDIEQKKIGEYFRNLDNLITLHQRKLDALVQLKKGMLQNMFI